MKLLPVFKKVVVPTIVAINLSLAFNAAHAVDITGAGATFPYPIYAKWADAYKKATGSAVNYQSVGSGAGIKQIKSKTVDFGASDMPLKSEDLDAAGLVQFPAIMGGLVPVINLDGIPMGKLKLSGDVLAGIYMGKINKWNAPQIAALNPDIKLPATDITVVYRSDGSGSTFLWTDYLSKVSPEFKTAVGANTTVKWPVGLGGKGNEGVASSVQNLKGSIGYVEYAYVKKNKMNYTQLKNASGNFISPTEESFKAAAANADWAHTPHYSVILTNQAGKTSWPVTGASFILVYKNQVNADKGREVLKFFDWSYKNGGAMAKELDYIPMPDTVTKLIEATWKTSIKDAAGKPVF